MWVPVASLCFLSVGTSLPPPLRSLFEEMVGEQEGGGRRPRLSSPRNRTPVWSDPTAPLGRGVG